MKARLRCDKGKRSLASTSFLKRGRGEMGRRDGMVRMPFLDSLMLCELGQCGWGKRCEVWIGYRQAPVSTS